MKNKQCVNCGCFNCKDYNYNSKMCPICEDAIVKQRIKEDKEDGIENTYIEELKLLRKPRKTQKFYRERLQKLKHTRSTKENLVNI